MSKVVLITGGSSGIGKAVGEFLIREGFKVYATSRNPERFDDTFPIPLLKLDVTDPDAVSEAISQLITREGRIDVLINNAGMGITGPIEETPDAAIEKAFQTNYMGPVRLIREVLPQMRQAGHGLIINITSIAGYMGLPYRGIYSATKSALEITTEALRMELHAFGVQVTNVAPGDFATNIAAGRHHCPVIKGSPYEAPYSKTLDMMNAHVDSGEDPEKMARMIHKIISTQKPRIHYKVGAFIQKFSIVLKRVLPDKVYERMVMRHYNLK